MRIEFSVYGDVQLNRDILRVSGRAQNMAPAFARVLELWRHETAAQFESEGDHASGGWQPLAVATVESKQRQGLRPEILRATDALLRSLTTGDENAIVRITPSELDYGTRLPYGRFHQRGTVRMSQRRPVAFTEGARRATIKILQRYLITGEVR